MRELELRGGEVTWDFIDYCLMQEMKTGQWPSEDLITIKYDSYVIDVGWYGGKDGNYCVKVISRIVNPTEFYEDGTPVEWDWRHPYAKIPCSDLEDMYEQLKRAIDLYPEQIKL